MDSGTVKQKKSLKKSSHTEEKTTPNDATKDSSTKQPETTLSSDVGNNEDGEMAAEERKARKKALKAARKVQSTEENTAGAVPSAESRKRGKKRKYRTEDSEDQGEGASKSTQPSTVQEPPKKKHKNRTEFADPRDDTNLNNQTRKALEYAFTQMNKPKKWKFNKAKQNWLIRNIWAPDAIADSYLPLVVKYLAGLQEGSREKLIQTCQTYLKGEEKTEKEEGEKKAPTSIPTNPPAAPRSILKKPTPGPLIDIHSPSESVNVTNPSTPAPITTSIPVLASLADIRRTRAQSLLNALSSSNGT